MNRVWPHMWNQQKDSKFKARCGYLLNSRWGLRWETWWENRKLTSSGVLYLVESKIWPSNVRSQSPGSLIVNEGWSLYYWLFLRWRAWSPEARNNLLQQTQGFNIVRTKWCPVSWRVWMRLWPVAGPALLIGFSPATHLNPWSQPYWCQRQEDG